MPNVSEVDIVQIIIKCKSVCFFAFNHIYLLFRQAKYLRTFFFLKIFLNFIEKSFCDYFIPAWVFPRAVLASERKKGSKIIRTSLQMAQDCLLGPVSQFYIAKCI